MVPTDHMQGCGYGLHSGTRMGKPKSPSQGCSRLCLCHCIHSGSQLQSQEDTQATSLHPSTAPLTPNGNSQQSRTLPHFATWLALSHPCTPHSAMKLPTSRPKTPTGFIGHLPKPIPPQKGCNKNRTQTASEPLQFPPWPVLGTKESVGHKVHIPCFCSAGALWCQEKYCPISLGANKYGE